MTAQRIRQVIWIPILHTQADLGSMSASVQKLHVRRHGQAQWDRHLQTIHDSWRHIEHAIEGLHLDYTQVQLYQDGLPNSGHEEQIVRDLARAGSHNHRLLLHLMARGARLVGTESPELLLEEYELARQVLVALEERRTRTVDRRQHELSQRLLEQRDCYIAERIRETLQPGGTGLVFLGMLHALDGRFPDDIVLRRLEAGRPGGDSPGKDERRVQRRMRQ